MISRCDREAIDCSREPGVTLAKRWPSCARSTRSATGSRPALAPPPRPRDRFHRWRRRRLTSPSATRGTPAPAIPYERDATNPIARPERCHDVLRGAAVGARSQRRRPRHEIRRRLLRRCSSHHATWLLLPPSASKRPPAVMAARAARGLRLRLGSNSGSHGPRAFSTPLLGWLAHRSPVIAMLGSCTLATVPLRRASHALRGWVRAARRGPRSAPLAKPPTIGRRFVRPGFEARSTDADERRPSGPHDPITETSLGCSGRAVRLGAAARGVVVGGPVVDAAEQVVQARASDWHG